MSYAKFKNVLGFKKFRVFNKSFNQEYEQDDCKLSIVYEEVDDDVNEIRFDKNSNLLEYLNKPVNTDKQELITAEKIEALNNLEDISVVDLNAQSLHSVDFEVNANAERKKKKQDKHTKTQAQTCAQKGNKSQNKKQVTAANRRNRFVCIDSETKTKKSEINKTDDVAKSHLGSKTTSVVPVNDKQTVDIHDQNKKNRSDPAQSKAIMRLNSKQPRKKESSNKETASESKTQKIDLERQCELLQKQLEEMTDRLHELK